MHLLEERTKFLETFIIGIVYCCNELILDPTPKPVLEIEMIPSFGS
jgi:hypothetical protein